MKTPDVTVGAVDRIIPDEPSRTYISFVRNLYGAYEKQKEKQ
jgi:hypothetical protein